MFRGVGRVALAMILRLCAALGWLRPLAVAYRSRARRLAGDARGRIRRWGVTFDLDLNDNVQRTFYYTGWYEQAFLDFLQRELQPSDTYVDIGAHVGIDAAFAARHVPQGKVIAFEPVADTVERLRASAGRLDNVQVVAAALGEEAGSATLYANPKWHPNDVSTRSRFGAGRPVCDVEMLRFDDWASSLPRMDVVKIDVEGGELEVLEGMSKSIVRLEPRVVVVEIYGPHLAAVGVSEAEVVGHLMELGYRREQRIGDNVVFRRHGAHVAPEGTKSAREWSLKPALLPAAASAVACSAWFAKVALVRTYDPIWHPFGADWKTWALVSLACLAVAWIAPAAALLALGRGEHARAVAGFLPDVLVLVRRLIDDDRVSRRRKLLLVVLAAYLAMPVDPIPDVIPVIGQLDDMIFTVLVLRCLLRSGGDSLVRAHWPGPESSLRILLRLAGRPVRSMS